MIVERRIKTDGTVLVKLDTGEWVEPEFVKESPPSEDPTVIGNYYGEDLVVADEEE